MANYNNSAMPGAEPDRPRTFYVPDPPRIPNVPPTSWEDVASDWTASLNQSNTGFDVSRLDHNNPSGCILGPPSQNLTYPPLLARYGLQVLGAAGFINHKGAAPGNNIYGRLAFAWYRNPLYDKSQNIHPILRPDMWKNITPRTWQLLQPSLRLASAILDDPVTLNYFHALAIPAASMDTRFHNTEKFVGFCKTIDVPDVLTDAEQHAAFQKIYAMRSWTSFQFNPSAIGAYGITIGRRDVSGYKDIPASKPDTRQSDIHLNSNLITVLEWFDTMRTGDQDYWDIYRDAHVMAGIKPDHQTTFNPNSAIYRTIYLLAATIVHEFAHAFNMAYFEINRWSDEPPEPWVRGNRSNEQGFSFENYIFGGICHPYDIPIPSIEATFAQLLRFAAPFGLFTDRQWDLWHKNAGGPDPNSRPKYAARIKDDEDPPRRPNQRYYPVPQEWCEFLFSDNTWGYQVARFGLEAIKVPKIAKWAVTCKIAGSGSGVI